MHEMNGETYIEVHGARVHNLKNIDLRIPRDKLVVITGLSGSGKSSLAFDTIYAEGQRRYMETFSAYARQFLGGMERPEVDKIDGLSPVISIEQKTTSRNPRSTVGTITEVYDFLRLLYARASDAYSYETGERMVSYTSDQILDLLSESYEGKKIAILAPLVKARKGHYRELFEQLSRQGFIRVRVNGALREIEKGMKLDRYKTHDIELVVDRLSLQEGQHERLKKSLQTAMKHGKGVLMVLDLETEDIRYFSQLLMCPTTGISYDLPEPNTFSFNSPKGACPNCHGLGTEATIDVDKIIPDRNKSIFQGAIAPLGEYKDSWIFNELKVIGQKYGFDMRTKIKDIPDAAMEVILHGADETFQVKSQTLGVTKTYRIQFEGLVKFMQAQYHNKKSKSLHRWAENYIVHRKCHSCGGSRLKRESLYFRIDDKNIAELSHMSLGTLAEWLENIEERIDNKKRLIAVEILKEIRTRLQFLLDVGLEYLALDRSSKTLSGGESQRIRLATQIGSQLVGVLYILDEPSIGLHQRDNDRLIEALRELRDVGNSVLVVEHDRDMIEHADHIIDLGPGAGWHGGHVVGEGDLDKILSSTTLTAAYLSGKKRIEMREQRREGSGNSILLKGASGNNLKSVDLEVPLGKMICVTGVSGSGKSTLVNETLYPILSRSFYNSVKKPLNYKEIQGLEHIDKVIDIDQSPIGRTPRSNPATYTGLFSEIRSLFAQLPEAKVRAYKPGRFSFNVKGGRCETCQGAGLQMIEMNFLPDVHVPCPSCHGKRFNRETLEVRYKGKSISEVLDMSIEEALEFFEHIPKIKKKLKTLNDVGLGYVTLGQQSTTLSGGEAQRIKLASELSKKDTGKTLYILDEPTTGLHFEDIRVLMEVLEKLVDRGNTVVIIEHNLDVVKMADHIVDLGPEGGDKGGKIMATGSPEEIVLNKNSITGRYLKKELER
jgi:excinuclease ABC subunit A